MENSELGAHGEVLDPVGRAPWVSGELELCVGGLGTGKVGYKDFSGIKGSKKLEIMVPGELLL